VATVTLKPGRDARLLGGHLWVYAGEVARVEGSYAPGDVVDVRAADGTFLGRGYLNPRSTIAVRLLTRRREAIDAAFFRRRLEAALALRAGGMLQAGPAPASDAYRLVYSEGDYLPGLIVDRYGDVLVVQVLTLGMARQQALLVDLLRELTGVRAIYARNDAPVRAREGLPREQGWLWGEGPEVVEIHEGPVRFRVALTGQKTGFFLDQRENRAVAAAYLSTLGPAPEALDAFCYTGAFSMHLARAGARVLGIDIDPDAVAAAVAHAQLNGVADRCAFEAANAFDRLRALVREGRRFDLVVLDPPAFARTRAALPRAAAGYKEINLRALRLLRPGGILVTCSCSAAVSEAHLLALVAEAAYDARREVRLLESRTQARDHPVHPGMPETRYLKCLILRVS